MSRVGALRMCSGTGRDPSSAMNARAAAVRDVGGVALRRAGEVEHRLGERELALGRAQALVGFDRIEREPQRARIGKPDVLGGHADHAPPDIERVGAAVEHAAQPVQRGVGVAAAHRLVQRGDLVVEGLAALVEAAQAARDRAFDEGQVDACCRPASRAATASCSTRLISRRPSPSA